jgi:hypothetical protein
MAETIFTQAPGQYHVQKTVGGWVVVFVEDRHNIRSVDGGKVHANRQNAYAKAYRLNASLQPRQFYTRNVDAGSGRQNVMVVDGVITRQWLEARQGYYTGDGNPELVGQPVTALRGKGFRHVAGPQAFNSVTGKWFSLDPNDYSEEEEEEPEWTDEDEE